MPDLGVVVVGYAYPPLIGGAEIHTQRLCAGLASLGAGCFVLTTRCPGMPSALHFRDEYGTRVRAVACRGTERRRSLRFALDVAFQLLWMRRSYHVVHWSMPGLQVLLGIPLAHCMDKVNVMRFAGCGQVATLQQSQRGRWLLSVLRRWADAVIVLNNEMRAEAEQFGIRGDRIHWIPCEIKPVAPPDSSARLEIRRRLGFATDALVLVFTGRFVPLKRLSDLLRSFAIVAANVPSAILVLAGDGPERRNLEAQAAGLGISDRVRFTGFLAEDQVTDLLHAADLFATISATEGIPCSLVEAMGAGLPCVVSDIPAMTQLVTHGEQGLVVPAGDVEAAAAAITDLLTDRDARLQAGRRARLRVVPDFTIDAIAAQYRRLYERLLGERQPGGGKTAGLTPDSQFSAADSD